MKKLPTCVSWHKKNEVTSELLDDSYNELHNAFDDLTFEFENLSFKYRKLEAKNQLLLKENNDLLNYKNKLSKENDRLTKEVDKLKPIIDKFTLRSQKLNLMLDNQKTIFDKAGLGCNPNKNQKYLKNMVSKTAYYKLDKVNKKYAGYDSMHISQSCTIKMMWISKENILLTNPKGIKKTWIPKTLT